VEVLKSGTATPVGNRILSNSIFQNQALGIDLSNSGTGGREQDAKDLDTGPNNLQNFPAITAATITGTLRSKPEKPFTVQLFSNPTGTDEGKTFLTQIQVKTNRKGKAIFSYFGTAVPQANAITAAATGADGTSEFSDPVAVVPAS